EGSREMSDTRRPRQPYASDDGLDLDMPDVTTPEEIKAFHDYYVRTKGAPLAAHEFWVEFRPDVLKRLRARVRQSNQSRAVGPLPHVLAILHYYVLSRFDEGILYETRLARSYGAARGQILDVVAIASVQAGAAGMTSVARILTPFLREWNSEEREP